MVEDSLERELRRSSDNRHVMSGKDSGREALPILVLLGLGRKPSGLGGQVVCRQLQRFRLGHDSLRQKTSLLARSLGCELLQKRDDRGAPLPRRLAKRPLDEAARQAAGGPSRARILV